MQRSVRRRWLILAAALFAAAAAGAAYATIPDGGGVIHACYNAGSNPSGNLRVIDSEAGAKCSKNEKALDWNQQGIKGDKGDQQHESTTNANLRSRVLEPQQY